MVRVVNSILPTKSNGSDKRAKRAAISPEKLAAVANITRAFKAFCWNLFVGIGALFIIGMILVSKHSSQRQPFSFNKIYLGMNISDFRNSGVCREEKIVNQNGNTSLYCKVNFMNKTFDSEADFQDDALNNFNMMTTATDFQSIFGALTDEFGPPDKTGSYQKKSRRHHIKSIHVEWKSAHVSMDVSAIGLGIITLK